jgi:hypothetical protein
MTKQFQLELKKLANKHNISVSFVCQYCGKHQETLEHDSPDSYFITFTPNKSNKKTK